MPGLLFWAAMAGRSQRGAVSSVPLPVEKRGQRPESYLLRRE